MTYVVLSFLEIYVTNCWQPTNHFQIIDELRILDIAPSLGGCETHNYFLLVSFVIC